MRQKEEKRKRGKGIMIGIIIAVIAAILILALSGVLVKREYIVGKDIASSDVTEFYYTYSSTTNPAKYQRYHFFIEDGKYYFYHESKEGHHLPLTDDDITSSGRFELSEDEWNEFITYLDKGTVKKREESTESGNAGPYLYLYWSGDRGKYQEFSFLSKAAQNEFEDFCIELKNTQ